VLLQVGHHPDAEAVPGIEPLLLHQEVHQLRQALVVPDPARGREREIGNTEFTVGKYNPEILNLWWFFN
jgi:hypothetical protein